MTTPSEAVQKALQAAAISKAVTDAYTVSIEDARRAARAIEVEIAKWPAHHAYHGCQISQLTTVAGISGVLWLARFTRGERSGPLIDVPFRIDESGRASMFFGMIFTRDELYPESETTKATAENKE